MSDLASRANTRRDLINTVYPKKYAHGFCFAVLCCGYTLTDFPISIRPTSLALWQSNDCPSASKATLMNMDKYFIWIHYERLHNHNKAKHNTTVCTFLGIYCTCTCFLVYHIIWEPRKVVQIYFNCIPGVISKHIQGNLAALHAISYIGIYTRCKEQVETKCI